MSRTLLGMITPSSNTVLEPYTSAILASLFPRVSAHFQRFTVREISLSTSALAQFETEPLLEAAELLSDARMDAIAWSGTAASWLGFQVDERLCKAIMERTAIPATTSVLALNEILERTNVARLGLVTPYLSDVQSAIINNYNAAGHEVVAEQHLGDKGNFSFSEYDENTLRKMIRRVAESKPEAITILCTNLRGAEIVEELEAETGIPIYDSVSVTVWKSLLLAGQRPDQIKGWGKLFNDPKLGM
ncbi:aspartate/glutamate racemase family protein [Paenalcaligenes niemegkensis]|uniref:maleate cis-trans isomerase family protein n=1 Tax=Paenalcaligenes niemegkensis TaxID=2895469 RepID=UPI001EE85B83|nr:aspartate/glutamate racemase family protein [Paenalcaligenes niemegkensis]MCQ9617901.1 aspartate/glutamate racemase family protein [Paenalcaligenes niemegkensis]